MVIETRTFPGGTQRAPMIFDHGVEDPSPPALIRCIAIQPRHMPAVTLFKRFSG
jgi:hypothetical protein